MWCSLVIAESIRKVSFHYSRQMSQQFRCLFKAKYLMAWYKVFILQKIFICIISTYIFRFDSPNTDTEAKPSPAMRRRINFLFIARFGYWITIYETPKSDKETVFTTFISLDVNNIQWDLPSRCGRCFVLLLRVPWKCATLKVEVR